MAKTTEQKVSIRGEGNLCSFPVASGQTIYGGTLAAVCQDGYLYNLSSTIIKKIRLIVLVADKSANITGPAATTSAGSVSGAQEKKSDDAGDKTVRECYVKGEVLLEFTSIAQSDVGKTVYASDNYTVDEVMLSAAKTGTLVTYISSTSGWVDLNTFYQADGSIISKGSMNAATGTTANGVLSWQNPQAEPIIIEDVWLDITSASTGAAVIDVGLTNNGSASNDSLIDGLTSSVAKFGSIVTHKGTNGGIRKCGATQYVGATTTATLAGLVGTYAIKYRLWE